MIARKLAIRAAATLPAILSLGAWALAHYLYRACCPAWCLTCATQCSVVGTDLGVIMVMGLLFGPYVVAVGIVTSVVLLAWSFAKPAKKP